MLRSLSEGTEGQVEFDAMKTPKHINTVWPAIERNFDKYWQSLIHHNSDVDKYNVLLEKFPGKPKTIDVFKTLNRVFSTAIKEYEQKAASYREFFDEDSLQEYQDYDPNGFKRELAKKCPIIRHTVNSKREELKDWQYKFRNKTGQELLDTFMNVLKFSKEYASDNPEPIFGSLNEYSAIKLEALDDQPELRLEGVIGSGIKSCVLYHLHPRLFPELNRRSMYGLYFLSEMEDFGLRSQTPEFLMINDGYKSNMRNIKMDHNYWYPFGLIVLYSMRLYRKIDEKCRTAKVSIDPQYRFVYVSCLFNEIWLCHKEHIQTMMCIDEMDI